MRSFRYPRTPRSAVRSVSLLAVLAGAALAAAPAAAQVPIPAAQMLPPQGVIMNDGSGAPAAGPKLPPNATIGDASREVQNLAAEAGKTLETLVGESAVGRDKAQIDELAGRKRRIMLLRDQLEEAKLAKQIWQELHGEKDTQNEEVKRLEEENRVLQESLAAAQQARQSAQSPEALAEEDPLPVVSSIDGAAEVTRAVILVPYVGIVRAETGSLLPNGMKVVSISKQGVVVEHGGKRKGLAFGGAVPMQRKSAQGQ